MSALEQVESKLDKLQKGLDEVRAELKAQKGENRRFKVGDKVTLIENVPISPVEYGRVYVIRELRHNRSFTSLWIEGDKDSWDIDHWRHATPEEIAAQEAKDKEIKAGDWVVSKESRQSSVPHGDLIEGWCYKVSAITPNGIVLVGKGSCYYSPGTFRKATQDEVTAQRKIKAGDWVVEVASMGGHWLVGPGRLHQASHDSDSQFVYLHDVPGHVNGGWGKERFRKATPAEVAVHLKKLEDEKRVKEEAEKSRVVVTVEGKDYVPVYDKGAVCFGCARIDNRVIRAAYDLMDRWNAYSRDGNRSIVGVQIGKGLFTLDILSRLLPHLKD